MGKEILIGGNIEFLTEDEVCIKFKPMIIRRLNLGANIMTMMICFRFHI